MFSTVASEPTTSFPNWRWRCPELWTDKML